MIRHHFLKIEFSHFFVDNHKKFQKIKKNYPMSYPNDMKFKFSWRSYQERVLTELDHHLEKDDKLHIIAPPGSGKTVLGLEVARQLNQPTLILAPNLTIRNQWAERLIKDFMDGQSPEWLTFDIKQPQFLTISTYQGLHAAAKADANQLIANLKSINCKTIVIDECHHLQREWWRSLMQVVEAIKPTIVALTATPPYDVSRVEWERYTELCGSIDAEINVGELVAEGNLCAHQDYILFSLPTSEETEELEEFHSKLQYAIDVIKDNRFFQDKVKTHPFIQNPFEHEESIFENPSYFTALLIYLEWTDSLIPFAVWEMLDEELDDLPSFDTEWLETLMNGIFFKDDYFQAFLEKKDLKQIKATLREIGATERKRIKIAQPERLHKQLTSSKSKINSIREIVELEYNTLNQELRMVILTDYIRKEAMPKNELNIQEIDKIGVVPIFELVRRQFPLRIELGILTGSFVVIPTYSLDLFKEIVTNRNIPLSEITTKVLAHDKNYLQISTSSKYNNQIVPAITALFEQGGFDRFGGNKGFARRRLGRASRKFFGYGFFCRFLCSVQSNAWKSHSYPKK